MATDFAFPVGQLSSMIHLNPKISDQEFWRQNNGRALRGSMLHGKNVSRIYLLKCLLSSKCSFLIDLRTNNHEHPFVTTVELLERGIAHH
jgi:hypothetical protein